MEVTQKSFARKKPDQLVYLELGSGNGGMVLSASEDGLRFRAVSPLRPNGLIPFAFSFDGSVRLQGVGEIEWLEDDGKSGGMRFVEVSPEFRDVLYQWLALDSRAGPSGREVTPATATPLDTMEKIRAELRRGYPAAAAKPSAHTEGAKKSADVAPLELDASIKESAEEPRLEPSTTAANNAQRVECPENSAVEERREQTIDSRNPWPAKVPENVASGRAGTTREQAPRSERPADKRAQPFYPPPFTQPAESESPAGTLSASSESVKKPAPSPPAISPSAGALHRAAPEPEPPRPAASPLGQTSTEALRRPFRTNSTTTHSERPYIPPVESLEDAWERAKLTAPPEPPHLSRAAAGSIIGVALAVILGALAFNFREDIGELVIDLGQKISGQNASPAPPAPALPGNKPESQPATSRTGSESSSASTSNKPESVPTQSSPLQSPNATNSPVDTHAANSTALHDTSAAAARDTSSPPPHEARPSGNTTPSTRESEISSQVPGRTVTGLSPQIPAGSTANPMVGSESGSGLEEFNTAREMLRGDHRQRDLPKAVDLLWAGVRKGYVPAEVTLADLYRRGDGVPKNCDQAQVLLVAASKKGSPDARHMLEQMAEGGCSE